MRIVAIISLCTAVLMPAFTAAVQVSGDQWGVWRPENNPYEVVGEIRVPPESTLVIEPGVIAIFKGYYQFLVDSSATLHAVGTETDSIYFTTDDTLTGWRSIRFDRADQSSELCYCSIEYGKAEGSSPDDHGGGVLCNQSSITISNNTFRRNSASGSGGGLCLIFSSLATVTDNLFIANTARWGGGMRCKSQSAAEVDGNTFVENRATDTGGGLGCAQADAIVTSNLFRDNEASSGGGINVHHCSPTVQGNLLESNQASRGGGLNSYYSEANITGNTIRDNSAQHGGGIYFERSDVEIRGNIINNNSALKGGGIHSHNSTPRIEKNTIFFNSASQAGGGLYWNSPAGSEITSSIFWGNEAPLGPQMHAEGPRPEITYCDVQGGSPGQGNIDSDPLFVSFVQNDFSLRWHSPCIDAGNPETWPDPDQTPADMGALHFDQRRRLFVEVWPHDEPIIIPPQGGNLSYDYWAYNFTDITRQGDLWIYVRRPDQQRTLSLLLEDLTIPPQDSVGENDVRNRVFRSSPEGYYTVVTCLGDYPYSVRDSSYFVFYKELGTGVDDFLQQNGIPTSFSLAQNYPNPFNARTVIRYQLPVDAHVRLKIYDLCGRTVAVLSERKQEAGQRSVFWDASEVSSGLYFYRLTANRDGEQLFSDVKKMLLVK